MLYLQVTALALPGGVGLAGLWAAGLDEGLLSLPLSDLLYTENPYSYKKCQ